MTSSDPAGLGPGAPAGVGGPGGARPGVPAGADAGLLGPVRAGSAAEEATGDTAVLQAMLDAEAALTRAQAALGLAPGRAAEAVAAAARADRFDVRDLALRARAGGNPVIPLVADLRAAVGEHAEPYVHRGATSQDILDTALVLVAARALDVTLPELVRTADALAGTAAEHRDTPMPGRTLTQHAVPTTFGLKVAGWRALVLDAHDRLAAVRAALPAQLGGAAGTLAAFMAHAEADALAGVRDDAEAAGGTAPGAGAPASADGGTGTSGAGGRASGPAGGGGTESAGGGGTGTSASGSKGSAGGGGTEPSGAGGGETSGAPGVAARAATRADREELALRLVAEYARELGLTAPALPWHTLRTPVADLGTALAFTCGALGKLATDVSLLARTETGEVAEGTGGGSSAMPHKSNPVRSTLLVAAARQAPSLAATLLHALTAEDERPPGAWHAEWQPLRELLRLAGGAARDAAELAAGLRVFPYRMDEHLALTEGLIVSERIAAALGPLLGRERAGRLLADASRKAFDEGISLDEALEEEEPGLRRLLTKDRLRDLADPARYTGAAGPLTDRALRRGPRPGPEPGPAS